MTPEQFVYWLQGFMEMADPSSLSETQTQQIKDHLKLVFDKQTPDRTYPSTDPFPKWQDPYPLPQSPFTPKWEMDPNIFRPICETPTSTTTKVDPINLEVDASTKRFCSEIEDSHNKVFNGTPGIPKHSFGEGKQNNIIKQAMEIASKDVQVPKVVREGKVKKNFSGRNGLKC